jgi:hypothetical protein
MALRPGEIYLQWKTKRRLRWVRAALASNGDETITIDELGDRMLNERIEQVYPEIRELEKQFEAAEDQIIQKLSG